MQKTYILENLGCANCAAKMEKKISELPTVKKANLIFATKKLKVELEEDVAGFDETISAIVTGIESDVVIKPISGHRVQEHHHVHEHGHSHEHGYSHGHEHSNEHCHGHERSHSHGHEHSHSHGNDSRFGRIMLIVGTIIFAMGLAGNYMGYVKSEFELAVMLLAYIALGAGVLKEAAVGIFKGQIFDENFLMAIATIGAFFIGEYEEAVGVMLFFKIGEYFEEKAVERSRNQIMDVVDLRPEKVTLYRDGKGAVVPAETVKIDDIVFVKPGERIPLDGIVVEGESKIDTSAITGEFVPTKARPGIELFSGCINATGLIKIKVTKTLDDSMVSRIMDSVENAAANKPKIDKFITKFARVYTPIVVLLALSIAIVPSMITGDWHRWIYSALTFLVISCPCALVLSVPLAFFAGIGGATKQGILFKGGLVLEALKEVKMVVMDKTGTITKGEFTLKEIKYSGNLIRVLSALNKGAINKEETEKSFLYVVGSAEQASNHPIALSIVEAAKKDGIELKRPEKLKEIHGKGIKAHIDGLEVLCGNKALMKHYNIDMTGYESTEKLGYSVTFVAIDGEFSGAIFITDGLKDDSAGAIAELNKMRIGTAMLTGDTNESADSVAKAVGIKRVFAKLLPEDKVGVLQKLRKEEGSIAFVGDGINDAPVLAGADVGIAMGNGTDAAIEAADVVILNSSLASVPKAIDIAKATTSVAAQNIVIALLVKLVFLTLGFFGLINMWLAVFSDSGVAVICVLNSVRLLYRKTKNTM